MDRAVPERSADIKSLWQKYDPDVVLVDDAKKVTLNADKERITFDSKTMDVSGSSALPAGRLLSAIHQL
jgi:tetraacyldisaccharide-1-P 4'-kinase